MMLHTFLCLAKQTPIGLSGRDTLCRLKCTIKCTPNGCLVEVPHENDHQMTMKAETEAPVVYWIGNFSRDLIEPARVWEKFILANLLGARISEYVLHCTLQ